MLLDISSIHFERKRQIVINRKFLQRKYTFDSHNAWDLSRFLLRKPFSRFIRYSEVLLLGDTTPVVGCRYKKTFFNIIISDLANSSPVRPFIKKFSARVQTRAPSVTHSEKSCGRNTNIFAKNTKLMLTNMSRSNLYKRIVDVSFVSKISTESGFSQDVFVKKFMQCNFENLKDCNKKLHKSKSLSVLCAPNRRNSTSRNHLGLATLEATLNKHYTKSPETGNETGRRSVGGSKEAIFQKILLTKVSLRKSQSLNKFIAEKKSKAQPSPVRNLNDTIKKRNNYRKLGHVNYPISATIKINCFLSRQKILQRELPFAVPIIPRKSLDQYVKELPGFAHRQPHKYIEPVQVVKEARFIKQTPQRNSSLKSRKSSFPQKVFDLRVK